MNTTQFLFFCHEDDYESARALFAGFATHSEFFPLYLSDVFRGHLIPFPIKKPTMEGWQIFYTDPFPHETFSAMLDSITWKNEAAIYLIFIDSFNMELLTLAEYFEAQSP